MGDWRSIEVANQCLLPQVRDLADPDERNSGRHLCGVTVPGAPRVHWGYRSSSEVRKNDVLDKKTMTR